MELTLGDKLKLIKSSFVFNVNDDSYTNEDFTIEWLEDDIFDVGAMFYDSDIGLSDIKRIDLMTEKQLLFYLEAWYYQDPDLLDTDKMTLD
jgi:hypothetical protein